ncbi:flagellar hook-associated protein FlgK [Curvivirga sp.]|uniref:flagellar hook-associated protein FlgK n=1 Tax=Curvivirga sp. TaxID=2856848 RepID=UPI003B5C613C
MSTTSISINASLTAMQTASYNISVSSANVANADTEGYTAKSTSNTTQMAGSTAVGVQSQALTNMVDQNLLDDLNEAANEAKYTETLQAGMENISNSLGSVSGDNSLSEAITDIETALLSLELDPTSNSDQIVLVDSLNDLTTQLNNTSNDIQDQRADIDEDIETAISSVNSLLNEIDNLNEQIAIAQANGNSTLDLEDSRNTALQELSGYMNVNSFTDSNNQLQIYTEGGTALLLSEPQELSYEATSPVTSTTSFNSITVAGKDITSEITGGEIGASLELRDEILPDLQAELDELASTLIDSVNAISNKATSIPSPATLTSQQTVSASDAMTGSGTFRIAVTDSDGAVNEYADFDASTYSTVQDFIDDLNSMTGVSASINADGYLEITTTTTDTGLSFNEMDSAVGGDSLGISNYFGFNSILSGDSATNISVSADLLDDPSLLPTAELNDSSTLSVGDTGLNSGDTSIISSLISTFSEDQSFDAAGNLGADTTSFANYATNITSALAVKTDSAITDAEIAVSAYDNLATSFANETGVNLDEEIAKMNAYQESYEAGAYILSTIQEMFDVLMNAVT